MLLRFTDEKNAELQSPFQSDRIPAAGEAVTIDGTQYTVSSAAPTNDVAHGNAGMKMITTVVLAIAKPAKSGKEGQSHGRRQLNG